MIVIDDHKAILQINLITKMHMSWKMLKLLE